MDQKEKMKVLNIMLSKELGGIQEMFCNYDLALRSRGHDVINVIHPFAQIKPNVEKNKAKIFEIKNFSKFDLIAKLKMFFFCMRYKPDVIICHGNRAASTIRFLPIMVPVVCVAHNEKVKPIIFADRIIIVSQYIEQTLLKNKYPKAKITHINNFI